MWQAVPACIYGLGFGFRVQGPQRPVLAGLCTTVLTHTLTVAKGTCLRCTNFLGQLQGLQRGQVGRLFSAGTLELGRGHSILCAWACEQWNVEQTLVCRQLFSVSYNTCHAWYGATCIQQLNIHWLLRRSCDHDHLFVLCAVNFPVLATRNTVGQVCVHDVKLKVSRYAVPRLLSGLAGSLQLIPVSKKVIAVYSRHLYSKRI